MHSLAGEEPWLGLGWLLTAASQPLRQPARPAAWTWAGGSHAQGQGGSGSGAQRGEGGALEVQSLTSNFLMFSGGQGLWEAASCPGSCGKPAAGSSSLSLRLPPPHPRPHPATRLRSKYLLSALTATPLGSPRASGQGLWSWFGSGREPKSQS